MQLLLHWTGLRSMCPYETAHFWLQGRYKEAWIALDRANHLQHHSRSDKHSSNEDELLQALQHAFPVQSSPRRSVYEALLSGRWGSRSQKPIFIVGMPRSGSSLLEQILASHPDVIGAGKVSCY